MKKTTVNCPTCDKESIFDKTNPYRPFCSERCKLIDLGEWASENHRIPGKTQHQNEHNDLDSDLY